MTRRSGFTLVELVVVILILGILAGVAAPKLFKQSDKATESGVRQTLAIVRDAIELYNAENGSLPACASDGTADFHVALADYIRGSFPTSPVGTKDNLITPTGVAGTTTADGATGWMYNTADGTFICNCTTATPSNGAIGYDDL